MCLTELSAAAISVAAALSSRIGSAPAVLVMAAKPRPRFVTCPGHVLRHRSSLLPSGILHRSFCSRYDVPVGGREREREISAGYRTVGVTSVTGFPWTR